MDESIGFGIYQFGGNRDSVARVSVFGWRRYGCVGEERLGGLGFVVLCLCML